MELPRLGHFRWVVAGLGFAFLAAGIPAMAQEGSLAAERNGLLSKLQSMGHGYYTAAEWDALLADIQQMRARAEKVGAWNDLVEVNLIEAMVYSDMKGENEKALKILEKTRKDYGGMDVHAMPKVFVRMAEVYSKMGDEEAIRRLIAAFRSSPYYDPERYPFTGGQGRNVPLSVVRPSGRGSDSISVTAMEMYRQQARFAPGRAFPDFQATDIRGEPIRLSDYRGKVVLLDFWSAGWTPWQRDLPTLISTYREYKPYGFDVIGINIEANPEGLNDFLARNGMVWPQIAGDPALARKLGVFGDATSFLLDRDGSIRARNLGGANLTAVVRQALGLEKPSP